MNNIHTLMSLCKDFNKIEVPIIQRDYAQGRIDQATVRNSFVDYLVDALSKKKKIELDFIYGNVREDKDKRITNSTTRTFIPIDGQQRLTTLWLLHWFLAHNENCLNDIANELKKFVYETRPSAHNFCRQIIDNVIPKSDKKSIDKVIINQSWFDNEWLKDGTVNGMLQMLHTFEESPDLSNGKIKLSQLLPPNNDITFYFVELKEFGMSEELYIRMNARGKVLTEFENFKSEFYRILKDNKRLDEVKDKMEYLWVENLWGYRNSKYLVDDGFMNYLCFITKMLYFRKAKPRADEYASNFKDLKLLKKIYSKAENVDFLIDALDNIPILNSLKDTPIFWQGNSTASLSDLLELTINGKDPYNIENQFSLFATILYLHHQKDYSELPYYIRVIRNLATNTADKSEREWPRILQGIDTFSKVSNVHEFIKKPDFNIKGFSDPQCKEEHFKSLLIPLYQDILFKIEDHSNFKGCIRPILTTCFEDDSDKINQSIKKFPLDDSISISFNIEPLIKIFNAYKELAKDDFSQIWGDLICTNLYYHDTNIGRVYQDSDDYKKSGAILLFAKKYANSRYKTSEDYSIAKEKAFILELYEQYDDFKTIRDVKKQLYLLYIITRRINNQNWDHFFRGGWNFGWLAREKGYSSLFTEGIEKDPWFADKNPIFQKYNSQFRYNMGLKDDHAIEIEIGPKAKFNLLEKVLNWASE